MLTADPQARTQRLGEILEILGRAAAPEDSELLLSFAPVVYQEMPDWMALGVPVPELAARLRDNFRFFVKEFPPPAQLYRGLPGIHVVVRNSEEREALHASGAKTIPLETTIVECHTPDAPFVFESLKNYLRKAGLRVFSAIHPILTVRRQWERIVWIGDAAAEGDKELLCRFRIERLDSKERLRHVQHEIFSVLKCVFLAVEDFSEMTSAVAALGGRLRPRREGAGSAESARAFLRWLLEDNYVFMGAVSYRIGADGQPDRIPETATGVFTDPTLLPVVFPGLVEEVEGHLAPAADDARIIDVDYCNNASAIYHLEPIDDIVVR
jgi:NAD-specific glutamate dehydrogenase